MSKPVRWNLGWIAAVAVMLSVLTGCEESPSMRRARITREEAFARDIKAIRSLEDHRSENLDAFSTMVKRRAERDQQATRDNARKLADWLPGEVREWKHKQPEYDKAIKHQLEGDPASIERTAPHFIY